MTTANQGNQSQGLAMLSGLHALDSSNSNDSCQLEQPPAYTPSTRTRTFENLTSYFPGQDFSPESGDSEAFQQLDSIPDAIVDDDLENPSPMSLRISTRIKVASDGNLIALPCSPAEQATSMASAIIEAIQGRDWMTGLPMIDENGRPRPLILDIDAGMTLEGSSNIVGTESVIAQFLRRGMHTPNKSPDGPSGRDTSSSKRRRRESKDSATEETVLKRSRNE
ncbi:hypothetical protein CGRA01v4_10323 [Colletotrichum graminicola]|nr:hypothetical protein CGRA01v4_10323 [Colletotrichum graminicola]